MDMEIISMELVGSSGEGKNCSFEALELAKKGLFLNSKLKMIDAIEKINDAYQIQTELIVKEASGQKIDINLLMIHAQNHLMAANLTRELISEIILLHEMLTLISNKINSI